MMITTGYAGRTSQHPGFDRGYAGSTPAPSTDERLCQKWHDMSSTVCAEPSAFRAGVDTRHSTNETGMDNHGEPTRNPQVTGRRDGHKERRRGRTR